MTRTLRLLVADDDPQAAEHLAGLLRRVGPHQVDVVASAQAALDRLRAGPLDALFLDVRMPGLSGIDVLRSVNALPRRPRVVLVSGYDDHVLEAFEAAAFDYLLKPVDEVRLGRTLDRLLSEEPSQHGGRVALPAGDRTVVLPPEDIYYLQARGDGVRAVTRVGAFDVKATLAQVLRRLPASQFLRVHRSYAVNLDHIREVHPYFSGTLLLRLDDPPGTEIPVSRQAARAVKLLLHL
ncbi:MAG: LytTR family DNA-binding domain-containing protein [Armatimonadota bacterium]|nr:LytTR family DNA-binding domain-containing protein [Armatimonadota bacterium]MDR5696512.1 LytTR family DNA-binding domain-containing protein [Armatimonadota bacterium]